MRRSPKIAALVRDIADWKFHGGDEEVGPREAHRLLAREGAPRPLIDEVTDIVRTISYKGAGVATPRCARWRAAASRTPTASAALGAIGIARCFAYGGHAGRPLYDPSAACCTPARRITRRPRGTASIISTRKLLLLRERMNTATGRALAGRRHRYMEDFVARFLREWDAADHADDA